jgi:phosphoglucosamine mutase
MKLFGSSGIRELIDVQFLRLTLELGLFLGARYASVIVGYDTRTTSPALKHALFSGLIASGATAWDAGVLPTPTLAYATRKFAAGAMVTASHNPPEYNGIKLWNPDGSAFDSFQRREIENLMADHPSGSLAWQRMGRVESYFGAIEEHIDRVLRDGDTSMGLKVVVDCGCGAASLVTPHLLRKMGCEVTGLNCYPSGFFPRGGEPSPQNLEILSRTVRAVDAALGIAHDGDADRMMVVDNQGRFIPGDKLLALLAHDLGAKKVVTTVDASMTIEELGVEVIRTKVGDAFVSEELKKGGNFGGEPSGSWIFPSLSYCPDGIYAAARIIHIASKGNIAALVDSFPSYPLLRGSVTGGREIMDRLEQKLISLDPLTISTVDGVRLSFADGWLLIRPSGTEPKIRITAEAKSETRVKDLYARGLQAIKECLEEAT